MSDTSKNLYKKLLGSKGERLTIKYLKKQGYKILEKNGKKYRDKVSKKIVNNNGSIYELVIDKGGK